MGSNNSNLVSSSSRKSGGSRGSPLSRTKRKLSHMFCGVFGSKSTIQVEDCPDISSISCRKRLSPVDAPQNSMLESSSMITSEAGDTTSTHENRDSSERSSMIEEAFFESSPLSVQATSELDTPPYQPSQASDFGSEIHAHDAISQGTTLIDPGHDQLTTPAQLPTVPGVQSNDLEYSGIAVVSDDSSDFRSLSIVSGSSPQPRFPGDDRARVTTTSSGFLMSDSDQDLRISDLLRLDLVSISSYPLSGNIAEANSEESRRNSMRLFWDALSRRSLRRHIDYPTIIFATGLADDSGSHDGWLLDFTTDFHYYGAGRDFDSFRPRFHHRNERRWLLRSEAADTTDGLNERGQETALCASGLHLDGTCSCDSFFTAEESRSLAGISRIILLAEALFEVLDEIQLQSLSLSLSTLSLPAPESIVDAFPLKYYKKLKSSGSESTEVRQCYICLSDYEEGDELRVLPCNHEFHVPCIDKWLKEVNRVCPLCRHDVCDGRGECSASNTD